MRLMYSDGNINVVDVKTAEMINEVEGWVIKFTTLDDEKILIKPKRDMRCSDHESCLNYLKSLLNNGFLNLIDGRRIFSVWE